jgi:hypothetical protein
MLFAHFKRILKLGRLRLRGPRGAQDEFTLAAIAQNLRRLAKLVVRPPPMVDASCLDKAAHDPLLNASPSHRRWMIRDRFRKSTKSLRLQSPTSATKSAQKRSPDRFRKCLLFGVDRTYRGHHESDVFDPKRSWAAWPNRRLNQLHEIFTLLCDAAQGRLLSWQTSRWPLWDSRSTDGRWPSI